jgi:hypothetical protein
MRARAFGASSISRVLCPPIFHPVPCHCSSMDTTPIDQHDALPTFTALLRPSPMLTAHLMSPPTPPNPLPPRFQTAA